MPPAAPDQPPPQSAKPNASEPASPANLPPAHSASSRDGFDASSNLPRTGDPASAARAQGELMQVHMQGPREAGQPATAQPAAASAATVAVPVEGLAIEIAARVQAGRNRFEIRLDPPELGRIEVRLDIDRHGQVTSRLLVERTETLDVLRRDMHELERALNQAGLKTGDNSLQLALRDQGFADRDSGRSQDVAQVVVTELDNAPLDSMQAGYGRVLGSGGSVDIRV
jgi:chemotaxis protein MotD